MMDMPAMVGRYFDAVHQVLDSQRQFVETMLNAAKSAQTFAEQALRVAERGRRGDGHRQQRGRHREDGQDRTSAVARMAKARSV